MINTNILANNKSFSFIGWKSYHKIKKKAMEQEFSWSGLIFSLSIAFFVVLTSAQTLSIFYQSIIKTRERENLTEQKLYRLEKIELINSRAGETLKKFFSPKTALAAETTSQDYQGEIIKWTDYLNIEAREKKEYTVEVKNIGKKVWEKDKVFFETGTFLKTFSKLQSDNWLKYFRPAALARNVAPGETVSITFSLKAPDNINGVIQENFQLVTNDRPVPGTVLRLFVDLKSLDMVDDKPQAGDIVSDNLAEEIILKNKDVVSEPVSKKSGDFCLALSEEEKEEYEECRTNKEENDLTNGISQNIKLNEEPTIRIGLFNTPAAQRITSNYYYDIYAGNQLLLSGLAPGYAVVASFDFKTKQYIVSTPGITKWSDSALRFVPRSEQAVMTLIDFSNQPKWNQNLNDNKFRNIIEFNYSHETKKLWIINELPVSSYLKGLAETTNYSPLEYQKAIVTAARTYTLYHYNRGVEYNIALGSTKHGEENFHLDAIYDQVYRGYNSEIRMSHLAQAVEETKGVVITYDNRVVVTPYFSRSDGRTRAWEEVWYGEPKPWLKNVAVPEDSGQELWGHGVGMSARAALIMIRDKGKDWVETLKYFYQGTELQRVY